MGELRTRSTRIEMNGRNDLESLGRSAVVRKQTGCGESAISSNEGATFSIVETEGVEGSCPLHRSSFLG